MIDKNHEHECNCQDDDCDCDCENSRFITMDMEDGTQKNFEILGILEVEEEKYIALAEPGADEYSILRMETKEDMVELAVIEDDELFDRVAEEFDYYLNSEAFEEEEE